MPSLYPKARGNICPQLEQTWGGSDCWGGGAPSQTRWRVVLSSGSQEGVEITRVWNSLESQAGNWYRGGVCSWCGGCWGRLSYWRELLMPWRRLNPSCSLVLLKDTGQEVQGIVCVAWKQRDKISSSWILALPGVDNSLTNA